MRKNAQLLLLAMIILAITLIVLAISTTTFVLVGGREENNLLPRYVEVKEKFPELMGNKLNTKLNNTSKRTNPSMRNKALNETFNATVSDFSALLALHGILFTNTSFNITSSTPDTVGIDYGLLMSDSTCSIRDPQKGFRHNEWRYNDDNKEWELEQDKYIQYAN